MTCNGIDSEVNAQLSITGTLVDGSQIELPDNALTQYNSSDLSVASFGLNAGEIFGGAPGSATITVSAWGKTVGINVTVRQFQPVALSAVNIPGYANNVDVSGDYAYVAAGAEGLQVVDVSDRSNPLVVAALDTDGTAIDIKVVGTMAYIADGEAGLKIIDITDPLAPVLAGRIDTAGVAQDLVIQLNYAYLANGVAGIEIIDISNPASPVSESTLENLGLVTGIAIEQDLLAVTGGSSLIAIDVSSVGSPVRLGSVNIGTVKDLALANGYAYVAAYSQGYRVVDMSNPMLPRITGGDSAIAPRDVALTRNFAFFAEQLFPNVVAFVNIFDPENPVFQGTINLSPFGDYAGTGIALDASYAYITEESFVVASDYKATGSTKLFIAQYRDINDNNGVAPTVSISSPANESVVVEGRRVVVTADAEDDIAVASVSFYVNGALVFTDTSEPYQVSLPVPAPDGSAMLVEAVATDLGGNTGASGTYGYEVQADTDHDGLGDDEELATWLTDPEHPDSDADGLLDGEEVRLGTDPNNTDSDADGLSDKVEVDNGTDPLNPDITPPEVSATDPADGSTDIAENTSIGIVFNEALLPKSVNSTVVVVTPDNAAPVAGSIQLTSGNTEILFVPNALLADYTLHTVSVSGLKDAAGNPMADAEFSFTTGNFVDTVRPSVLDISPANNSDEVPLNSVIDIILSEPIIPETVTEETFYVIDRSTNQRFAGVLSVSDDKGAISFVPNSPFLVGRNYQVVLTDGIRDLFGLPLHYSYRYFTSSFESDGLAPQVADTTILSGATNVPTNANLKVQFSEVISALYLDQIQLLDQNGAVVPAQRSLSDSKRIVTLDPVALLNANSDYTFVIDGVRDLSGNLLPNPVPIAFTTAPDSDTASGGISHWSFQSNATLPRNAVLEVRLSERIDPTTINTDPATGQASFALYSTTQNRFMRGRGVLAADGQQLRFEPLEALQAGHDYTLYVTYNTYLFDLAGNRINGTSRRFYVSFEEDGSAPEVAVSSIVDGTVGLPVNGSLLFRFSEPVGANCLAGIALSDGVSPVAASLSLSADQRTLTVDPTVDLAANSAYTLSLSGVCDYAGNLLGATALNFTTGNGSDTAGPNLVSITPGNNATGVPVTGSIVYTFDEALNQLSAPQVNGAGSDVAGTYTVSGNTITFTPSVALAGSTQYYSYLYTNVMDLAGNSRYIGYRYFTTEAQVDTTAPTVVAVAPEANAIDVNPIGGVVLSFSEPMAASTITNGNILFHANGNLITPSVYRSLDGQHVTLSATLPSNSVVSVVVTDRVTDLSGNAIAPYVSSFTTATLNNDGGRPSVSRTVPGNGSAGWIGLDEVVLYVNEPLDPASVEAAFHIAENGVLVDDQGVLEVLGNGQTIRFTKNTPFAEGALVQVYLSDLAADLSNNPLNNYSAYFNMGSTSDGVGSRPYPTAYSRTSGLPTNAMLQVLFSEELDASSLSDATVYLRNDSTYVNVPISLYLNTDAGDVQNDTHPGRILTVQPQVALDPDTRYYLWLGGSILDTDGDSQIYATASYFYTATNAVEDDRAPMVLAINPPDGESSVGVNPYYALRFDEAVNGFAANVGDIVNLQFSEDNQVVRYSRPGTLPVNTEVTETAPAFLDLGGNAASASTTFETGNGPDLGAGGTTWVSVAYNTSGVPLNPILTREFGEPLDPVSVTESGVYLYDTSLNQRVAVTTSLSSDGRQLTMVPVAALAPGRQYYWTGYYLRDIAGNGFSNETHYFSTGFDADVTAPVLQSATVFDGQTEVPTNVRLSVRFDEPLNPIATSGYAVTDGLGNAIPVNLSFSSDRRTVTLVPKQLLSPNSTYTLTLAGVEDVSGNAMATPETIAFTTGAQLDSQQGSVSELSFAPDATLPRNAVLAVNLSKRIDPTSINTDPGTGLANFALYNSTLNSWVQGVATLGADGRLLTFEPSGTLSAGHSFTLYITYNTYLYDLAGNHINGTSRRFFTSFATDEVAPLVSLVSFPDGAAALPLNARLSVKFNEPINPLVPETLVLLDTFGDPVATSIGFNSDRTVATLSPVAGLLASSDYQLALQAVEDVSGNALETPVVYGFSTGAEVDATRASVVAWSFASDQTLATTTALQVSFDERLDPVFLNSADTYLYNELTGTTIPGALSLSVDRMSVQFNPDAALPANGRFRWYVGYGSLTDYAGNRVNATNRWFYTSN
jgi:uncharacterized lipoprotein YbaY